MRSIHIHMIRRDGGSTRYTVREGDRYHDEMTFDEMLGQIVNLCHPSIGEPRYDMLTAEQWSARQRLMMAQLELSRAKDESDRAFSSQ